MSKSRGTGISPLRYLELGMNAEWLRYYIAAKLNAKVEDIDFNPEDFVARVNSDLVGKYVNIASRAAGFLTKRFDGELSASIGAEDRELLDDLTHAPRADRSRVIRRARVRQGAARDDGCWPTASTAMSTCTSPGSSRRSRTPRAELHEVCSHALHRGVPAADDLLEPVLPALARRGRGERSCAIAPLALRRRPAPAGAQRSASTGT